MANTLTFAQISTILNSVHNQATGNTALAATNSAEFVSQAQTALLAGYDTVLNAINQVLTRTIFSIRPYSAKFRGMEVSEAAWGNHVRKLSIADKAFEDDERYKWPVGYDATQTVPTGDGQAVDMYKINKPLIQQTNFYGSSVYQEHVTVFRDQLQQAFQGPDEFGSFTSLIMTNRSDKLEQARENLARATLCNLITAINAEANTDRVIHLLTEYNTATGLSLTATTVYQPANFKAFIQWMYARIATIASLMTERSSMYQTVINSLPINRHTPYQDMRVYLYAPARYQSDMMALADVYHDSYLRLADNETVNFWQSIKTPDSIQQTASYIDSSGVVQTTAGTTALDNVLGVIFDREAAGFAVTQAWSQATPFNAAGGYSNIFDHATLRCYNDMTEKAVILLLD